MVLAREDVKAGGVTDPDALLDALLVVGDVGDDGEAERMDFLWIDFLRGFVNSVGLWKCPGFQAKADCWRTGLSCAGLWCLCF